jgi:hypothetical protein
VAGEVKARGVSRVIEMAADVVPKALQQFVTIVKNRMAFDTILIGLLSVLSRVVLHSDVFDSL